jgi:hypothetical protein
MLGINIIVSIAYKRSMKHFLFYLYIHLGRSSSSPLTALPPSPDTTNNIAFSPALPERRRQSSNSTSTLLYVISKTN